MSDKESKFKIDDEVIVLRTYDCDKDCINEIGQIYEINGMEDDGLWYRVEFGKSVCGKNTRCEYSEKEICLNTKKEIDKYWLMKYRD